MKHVTTIGLRISAGEFSVPSPNGKPAQPRPPSSSAARLLIPATICRGRLRLLPI